tara:strand:+ start:218 stop:403 length:186 start_codon:yes stop_codon:yes gene_type:complete
MKPKKEVTEQDLELLQKHINTTKLRLIDMQNQFNKSLGRIRGIMLVLTIVLVTGLLIGYAL